MCVHVSRQFLSRALDNRQNITKYETAAVVWRKARHCWWLFAARCYA